jgi:hypothetical protein
MAEISMVILDPQRSNAPPIHYFIARIIAGGGAAAYLQPDGRHQFAYPATAFPLSRLEPASPQSAILALDVN